MKCKDEYYNSKYQGMITIDKWFKHKDYYFIFWKGHSTIKELFGINLQPKRRHRRHIKKRDYGRLFHCRKFYYDPFWDGEEEMDYFEELERLREIEGFKE